MDTLKTRSYGVKNPTQVKEEHHQRLLRTQQKNTSQARTPFSDEPALHDDHNPDQLVKRTYPVDKYGNYDEWAAVLDNQFKTATKLQKALDTEKRNLLTMEYGKSEYLQGHARKQEAQEIMKT